MTPARRHTSRNPSERRRCHQSLAPRKRGHGNLMYGIDTVLCLLDISYAAAKSEAPSSPGLDRIPSAAIPRGPSCCRIAALLTCEAPGCLSSGCRNLPSPCRVKVSLRAILAWDVNVAPANLTSLFGRYFPCSAIWQLITVAVSSRPRPLPCGVPGLSIALLVCYRAPGQYMASFRQRLDRRPHIPAVIHLPPTAF